jgi:hypothetical protein
MATTLADRLGFVGLLSLGLLAAGGAASAPAGLLIGMPTVAASAAVIGLLATLWWRGDRAAAPWLALLLVPIWLVTANLISRGALSGPPLWSLFLGGVAGLLARGRRVPSERAFFLGILVLYLFAAGRVQSVVGPEGDEPHYLMVADSLVRDHDVDVTRDYAEARYRPFHALPLEPHFRIRGRGGEIYSVHALGLSLLVLPAYALAGYAGASFFLAFLAALLAREIRRTVLAFCGRPRLASGVAWVVALSPPLLHYAGLIFTEVPAALILAFGLRKARSAALLTLPQAVAWGAALAFLPWLNVRYVLFPVLLLAYAVTRGIRWRPLMAALAPLAASAVAIGIYHFALYGFFDPRRVYGRSREFALGTLVEGLPGLFLDQEFGIFIYAPVFVLAVAGTLRLWRGSRRDALLVTTLVVVVVVTAGSWDMWRGGFNPPARFLVPLLPVLAVALAFGLGRGLSAPAALLVGWGLWTGLAGAANPGLVHRDRDGTAPFFRANAGAEEWTRLLPGFVLADPDRWRLTAVWLVALGLVAAARPTAPTPGRVAVAVGVLLGAVALSSRLSHARTEGRDAVRLVGRRALAIPAFHALAAAPGRWGPAVLDWGPLYEPHRFPNGATLGSRLRLPPGRYELRLSTEPTLPIGIAPQLLQRGERPGAATRLAEFRPDGAGNWQTRFTVDSDEASGLRLAVLGGSAFFLAEIELRASTISRAPGPTP